MELLSHDRLDSLCRDIGIDLWGVVAVEELAEESDFLEKWISKGKNGSMGWLEKYQNQRRDPRNMEEWTRSVLMIGVNYHTEGIRDLRDSGESRVSSYVTEVDYHHYIKMLLYELAAELMELVPDMKVRPFTDTAPVMEKVWAQKAGIGWMGKHTNIISPQFGSEIFLGGLLLNIEFDHYDAALPDRCGTCSRCMTACPTNALSVPHQLTADKCISYLTIENREENLPEDIDLADWIYGCDICQDVCPWNIRFSLQSGHAEMQPLKKIHGRDKKWWKELGRSSYNKLVKKTAMNRQKYDGIVRNADHGEKKEENGTGSEHKLR